MDGLMSTADKPRLPCPNCGQADQLCIGQSSVDGRLRWYESVYCSNCGLVTEADGVGFPPAEIRNWLLATGGEWAVTMTSVNSIPALIKAVKEHISVEPASLLRALKREGPKVVYAGTRGEAIWLSKILARLGEQLQVVPAGRDAPVDP
jgi:hypothetical protein